ncbi:MAG: hypothetical protein ABJN42_28670, partial [Roseibium sp.]|uniref:hypothetical protein n=2 Tax=Roseibium sp. TaxID=1936156 RepID=UPI00329833CE
SRPSGMKWYKNEDIPRWIGALSAALSAAAIIVAVSSYLLARYCFETELVVSAPEVIEFRCSTASFEPSDCTGESSNFVYLSLTAAFRISAVGPDLHEAALKGMDALVSIPRSDGTTDVYRLRSFWSGDLVGTENPGLKQSVPLSLKGGQSISQEIWFFPISVLCESEACDERQNFLSWHDFKSQLQTASALKLPGLQVEFRFDGQNAGGGNPEPIVCSVNNGSSLATKLKRIEAREDRSSVPWPISVTLPCTEFLKGWGKES